MLPNRRMRRAHSFNYIGTFVRERDRSSEIYMSAEASLAPPTNSVASIAEAMKMVKDCGMQEKLL